jgi:dienelactone hydrolase
MRTSPQYAHDVRVGPEGWRPAPDGGRLAILQPPGSYTVRLSVGGRELSQPLTVIKDPYSGGSEADIQAQMTTLFQLRRDLERAADLVNGIEVARSQIERLERLVEDDDIKKTAGELNHKLIAIEQNLVDLRQTGRSGRSWGSRLASNLSKLASQLATSDFKPTNQQLEVQKLHEELLANCETQFKAIRERELTEFNQLLQKRNIPHVIITAAPPMN